MQRRSQAPGCANSLGPICERHRRLEQFSKDEALLVSLVLYEESASFGVCSQLTLRNLANLVGCFVEHDLSERNVDIS